MLYLWLYPLHTEFAIFNVFRYLSFRIIYAAVTAFLIVFFLAPPMIKKLQTLKLGQKIRTDGPQSHLGKSGTPTMGGLLIIFSVLLSTVLWADISNFYVWLVLLSLVGFGMIGFVDDYIKILRGQSKGLTATQKIVGQLGVALGIGLFFYLSPGYSTELSVPFFKNFTPDLGVFYIPFAVLVIVGCSNAVNLTDGLDGLAVGPVIISAMAYSVVAWAVGNKLVSGYLLVPHIEGAGELAILTASIVGAGLGFLWFNTYPASVFMGDVGSLPLGAALGTVAVVCKHELLLILVGGVFVMEAVSVIFQVASFKSRGKRIFLMAPLHHHFELKGWEEPKVVVRLWIIAIILGLLSISTLKLR
ncbi:phospho-N-acetylmuramoyl-pentapeptide-transferase [Nitrospira sp. T9]|jgi:phospho-N-acetylmuramoyl-pentapeptide-transferase|uniref:Phospho-N-acetylmuramoyl-pentapeptide-transferase n=2 Tax=Nitrospira TaxID=1234 RepID=A0AA96K070_9BACT|nr:MULTISPECIES: phospho-N-acetylmuramoyl-pentapeptide-transferase [Nitrospira]WNM59399.1 phospho-N-acetylmuramoyl-pentapeptide-transferase [Candidatus Nitrospira allomarina]WNM61564.1 phospho-N-acetylmuramoyl-pentapeptide-transferase [Candidatus Nitrospira neomarina]